MTITIDAGVQRLHQLVWQPGEWMHAEWWQALTMDAWHQSYRDYPECRAAINLAIIQQRAFPCAPLPSTLNDRQQQLLGLESRLPRLCTALGLLALGCPDYLLNGSWRRRLVPILGEHGCDQLLAIGKFHVSALPLLAADQINEQALARGLGWWRSDATHCPVWQALTLCLPPGPAESADNLGSAIPWLLRIGRFL